MLGFALICQAIRELRGRFRVFAVLKRSSDFYTTIAKWGYCLQNIQFAMSCMLGMQRGGAYMEKSNALCVSTIGSLRCSRSGLHV